MKWFQESLNRFSKHNKFYETDFPTEEKICFYEIK